jgi:hypothetical protein
MLGLDLDKKQKKKQNKTKQKLTVSVILHLLGQVNSVRFVVGIFFVAPAARELGSDSCPEQHQLRAMSCQIRFGPSVSSSGLTGPSALLSQSRRQQCGEQRHRCG